MLVLSALLCVGIALCYYVQPDSCAAVTFWPSWVWLGPGLILVALSWTRKDRRLAVRVAYMWLLFAVAIPEESVSLARFHPRPIREWSKAKDRGRALRVVSVNCAARSEGAEEAGRYGPDVVLLQESPPREEVDRLVRRLFKEQAGVVWGPDTSVLAKGDAIGLPAPPASRTAMTPARVRLASGLEIAVVSIHLSPPVLRLDLWNPGCWREQRASRRLHREQVRELVGWVESAPRALPLVVGGDFNAPGGDAALRPLRPRLHDTFNAAGRGWGNTVLNDFPVSRFDQAWVSKHLRAAAVVARKTRHSDHRLIVCDLILR